LSEIDPIGGDGPDDGAPLTASIPLGNAWVPSPFEDLSATITVVDTTTFEETDLTLPVIYTGGDPLSLADFNRDGSVDGADYEIHNANHLTSLDATTHLESQLLGDMDGDLDNDHADFVLFKQEFIALHGAAAFAALGVTVPEPASGFVAIAMLACPGGARMRRTASA